MINKYVTMLIKVKSAWDISLNPRPKLYDYNNPIKK